MESSSLLSIHNCDWSSKEEGPRHVKKLDEHPAKSMHSVHVMFTFQTATFTTVPKRVTV